MSVAVALLWILAVPWLGLLMLVLAGVIARPAPRRVWPASWPSVSVIVPAHDEERSLPATLASLSAQRYRGPLEIVVVDDRSTDGTAAVVERFTASDPRIRLVRVVAPGRRLSPKVHAVDHGIRASDGEIILTTDADCTFDTGWVETMVSYFAPDVAMVTGYVHSTTPADPGGPVQRFDAVDWLTLMLTSRSLAHFGWALASSANNQAYRRSAFHAAGGFGASGRAPSGDEDLFVQRIGRLPGWRVVFADDAAARVRTEPTGSLAELLRQRRRWVSRYHHVLHYHPWFLGGIVILGAHSVALAAALLNLPFAPWATPFVLGEWALVWLVQLIGLRLGSAQLGRRDLWGWPAVLWALLHPAFIATVSLWSLIQPGDWGSGSPGYRRRFLRRRLREVGRKLRTTFGGA